MMAESGEKITNDIGAVVTRLPPIPQLNGRIVWRVILHNGVATAPPPRSTNEKSMFHKNYPGGAPMGRPTADTMVITPIGIYASFGTYEKLVPFANIYECDLAPAEFP